MRMYIPNDEDDVEDLEYIIEGPFPTPVPQPHVVAPVEHHGYRCLECSTSPIVGIRYTCAQCPYYHMCATCEANMGAPQCNPSHALLVIKRVTLTARAPYLDIPVYPDKEVGLGAMLDDEVARIIGGGADEFETLRMMRAEVEAAARRGGGGPITFALGAHLSVAKQEFGWENYDLSPRDQLPYYRVFSAYAKVLGYTLELDANSLTSVILVPDNGTGGGDGGDGGGSTATGPIGGDGGGDTAGEAADMTDDQFEAHAVALVQNYQAHESLAGFKAMIDGSDEARKKRFVYTFDANDAAAAFGLSADAPGRVVEVFRKAADAFGWDAGVKKSSPPSYTLSVKKR